MASTFGLREVASFSTEGQRPKNWREGLNLLFPNGDLSLTGLTALGSDRTTDDPEYSYFEKDLEDQGGAFVVTEVYTDSLMASKKTGTVAAGDVLYVKVPAAVEAHIRPMHVLMLVDQSDPTAKMLGKVTATFSNAANSRITIEVLVAVATGIVNVTDYADIVGTISPEGTISPTGVTYEPTRYVNYTQIFKSPVEITGTAMNSRFRTGNVWTEMKREGLQYHGLEMEQAMFFGEKTERTSTNGKKERTSQGGISFVNENYSTNVVDFPDDSALTWLQGGEDWFDEKLELLFRWGRRRKLGICGNGAMLGIMKLAKNGADINLTPKDIEFGISVREWVTPFGTLLLNTHPLFTQRVYNTNTIFIVEPENIQHVIMSGRDTMFQDNIQANDFDGQKAQWRTEMGFQWNHPKTMGYMTGVGLTGV